MKKIVLCLGLDTFDRHIASYLSGIPQLFEGAQIHIVHVVRDMKHSYPASEMEESTDLEHDGLDADDLRAYAMQLGIMGAEKSISAVLKGSPSEEILRYIHAWDIDLAFLGKRNHDHGSGYLASQIAPRSSASLWLIPERDTTTIHRVLLATDFSESSGTAYECTKKLIDQLPQIQELFVLSTYYVPAGYFKSGFTYDQMSEKMRLITERGLDEWLTKQPRVQRLFPRTVVEEEDRGTARAILDMAASLDAGLVVLGSRGRSGLAAFLLGSTADRIIRSGNNIPVFVAKSHDEQEKKLLKELFSVE